MKRAFAIILALTLMLSLAVPVFAAEDGSIVITNATKDHVYKLYKIFDASYDKDAGDTDGDGTLDTVSYSISETVKDENNNDIPNPIFTYMFTGEGSTKDEEKGTISNTFFTYVIATGLVTRNKDTKDDEIFEYLADMVRALDENGTLCLDTKTADSKRVEFTGLGYGYYLIDKGTSVNGTDVAVTITSNTPTVNVIDKNQKPASEFSKLVWDDTYRGDDAITRTDVNGKETTGRWVTGNSANIGDIIDFKVEFNATNYDGDEQVEYYSVMDTKGDALWVEFDKIRVTVGGVPLERGYYHGVTGTHNTGEWKFLGTWPDVEAPEENNPDDAQWYLVHYGYDKFEIVIPWMSGHDFSGTEHGFTLTYGDNADSIYDSPVDVIVEYVASVEPGANIGAPAINNLWNTAELSWNGKTRPGTSTTHTGVYALGLHKIDSATSASMAGVEFEIYSDEACTKPVYIIPTKVKGVYILDDLYTIVSGEYRESSREKYKDYLDAYLGDKIQKNVLTTEANGKFVVLGLEAGDYYLKETKTLDGYNILSKPEKVTVGQTNSTFYVIVDGEGNVVDTNQVADGYTKHEYTATPVTVKNSKGVQLPSTGGEGTLMLVTIGSVVAMAFAVLLITQKKMSIYND